jgi:vitamin B12 transporter
LRVLCLAAVLAFASPAAAQELFTPDLIVEGTKTGTPIEQMTGTVTIIDEATIRALRVPTVGEVLRQVEGLDVVQSGGPGGRRRCSCAGNSTTPWSSSTG